ncbi:hypothetical protein ABIF65_006797 [Bradyrhizobium japonicum]|nr:hypothetical protein [Bradyrhizobium japonicum]MCP1960967.1 hypothetical protein [Bradyrhizobium japonicum]MCW2326719.1 hypothetical protein [Bradyrhizobium japonicum]
MTIEIVHSFATVKERVVELCSRRAILFIGPAHDDTERVIRQRWLQRLGLVPRRVHPNVALLIGRQDHRHGLRMDRLDHRVRRCRQKPVDLMRPRHWLGLRSAITLERRPDAREGEQQTLLIQYEPDHILLR